MLILLLCLMNCSDNTEEVFHSKSPVKCDVLGVWWWDSSLINDSIYLDFAINQGVNEIYLCDSSFDSNTANFISKCHNSNIRVYYLAGEYQWIHNTIPLFSLINSYRKFQTTYPNSQFAGINLDIEPHQDPDFHIHRSEILQKYTDLIISIHQKITDIHIDYVIPFWFNDTVLCKNNNSKKVLYKVVFDNADRVFVMSYRDNAENMFNVAKDEFIYSCKAHKTMFFSALTSKSKEGNNVTYFEEGKKFMYQELNKLDKIIFHNDSHTATKTCLSIQQIKTWYLLKD